LGDLLTYQDRLPEARAYLDEAVAILTLVFQADPSGLHSYLVGAAVNNRAGVAMDEGDFPGAKTLLENEVARQRARGEPLGVTGNLALLGNVCFELDDLDGAEMNFSEALRLARQTGDR